LARIDETGIGGAQTGVATIATVAALRAITAVSALAPGTTVTSGAPLRAAVTARAAGPAGRTRHSGYAWNTVATGPTVAAVAFPVQTWTLHTADDRQAVLAVSQSAISTVAAIGAVADPVSAISTVAAIGVIAFGVRLAAIAAASSVAGDAATVGTVATVSGIGDLEDCALAAAISAPAAVLIGSRRAGIATVGGVLRVASLTVLPVGAISRGSGG
jgi:hypothetical protein